MKLTFNRAIVFLLGFLPNFCSPQLGQVEIVDINRVYVLKEVGLPIANSGNLEEFFNLTSQTRIYNDQEYYLAINVSVISNISSQNPRFDTVIEFENFEVTNPKIESVEGGKNFEHTSTLEDGTRSKISRTTFSLSPGVNTEIDYYLIYQISPIIGSSVNTISSKVSVSFERNEVDNFEIFGRYQDGSLFTINIENRD
jgi:hypothetical protein